MMEAMEKSSSIKGHKIDPSVKTFDSDSPFVMREFLKAEILNILSSLNTKEAFILKAWTEDKTTAEIADILNISEASVRAQNRKLQTMLQVKIRDWLTRSGATAHPASEAARENFVNTDQIIERATEVIGDRDEALRWLGTPVRGLDYATPISLLGTDEGAQLVNDILGQMEHGIW
jgi:putative toxin-antitoxin system antitoxin component (TIGR02293 family)